MSDKDPYYIPEKINSGDPNAFPIYLSNDCHPSSQNNLKRQSLHEIQNFQQRQQPNPQLACKNKKETPHFQTAKQEGQQLEQDPRLQQRAKTWDGAVYYKYSMCSECNRITQNKLKTNVGSYTKMCVLFFLIGTGCCCCLPLCVGEWKDKTCICKRCQHVKFRRVKTLCN